MRLSPAELLLQQLGVTKPGEIDLEAIAWHVGARVKFRPLDGCEARIIGRGDKAIITVNLTSPRRRRRFSIAHELGHWQHHRGKPLVCRAEEFRSRRYDPTSPERIADAYASDLLIPNYLFRPMLKQLPKLTFKAVDAIADMFDTSRTAAAIRLVEADHSPALLVCHSHRGRKWFARAPSVPAHWFPNEVLDAESFAFGVLNGKLEDSMPRKIGADAWLNARDAGNYEVQEQSIRTAHDEVLTLVLINDPQMLRDRDDRWSGRSGRR